MCARLLQSRPASRDPMDYCSPPGSSVHGGSPGKNTGVGGHALLQGVFPTQGPDLGIKPQSVTSPALAGGSFTTGATWEAPDRNVYLGFAKSL